jgi:glycine oxidase
MLSPGAEAEHASPWLDLGVESLRLYSSFVEELRGETGLAIDYRVAGCLVMDQEERQARARLHVRAGIRVEECSDGLFYPDDALVDPAQLLRALKCAAETRGARFEKRRLSAIDADQHAAVVVAAGAWSGALKVTCAGQRVALPATVPVKGHLIGFDMPRGTVGPFLRRGAAYVLQRADGLVVAGSDEQRVGFDAAIDDQVCRKLHEDAAALVPALESKRPSKRWIGFRPALAEGSGPRMERVKDTNVWLAYGHYRNGILLTPVTAARVAAEVISDLQGA